MIQRKDDTAAVLKSRLEAFHKQTEPVCLRLFCCHLYFGLFNDTRSAVLVTSCLQGRVNIRVKTLVLNDWQMDIEPVFLRSTNLTVIYTLIITPVVEYQIIDCNHIFGCWLLATTISCSLVHYDIHIK